MRDLIDEHTDRNAAAVFAVSSDRFVRGLPPTSLLPSPRGSSIRILEEGTGENAGGTETERV